MGIPMTSHSPDPRALAMALVLLLVGGGAYWTLSSRPDQVPPPTPATGPAGQLDAAQIQRLGIRLEPARAAESVPVGTVPGMVTLPPEARVAVTSPFAGTALRVLVTPGQQVTAGQALAVVRAPETIQFGAELARAEADLAFARNQAARLDTLAREGVIAGVRADEARAALHRTEATSRENRRLLGLAGAGRDGTVTLRAPIAGRVASVTIDPGAPVGTASAAPFVIENDAALALDLQIPERLAAQVRPGMTVAVLPPGATSPAGSGRILSVSPSLDPQTRAVMARASLGAAAGLIPGKGVSAVISDPAGPARAGVSVPSGAVTRMDDADQVFVHAAGRFAPRKVVVVAESGGRTVLASGLKPGETVAVSGVAELKSLLAGR